MTTKVQSRTISLPAHPVQLRVLRPLGNLRPLPRWIRKTCLTRTRTITEPTLCRAGQAFSSFLYSTIRDQCMRLVEVRRGGERGGRGTGEDTWYMTMGSTARRLGYPRKGDKSKKTRSVQKNKESERRSINRRAKMENNRMCSCVPCIRTIYCQGTRVVLGALSPGRKEGLHEHGSVRPLGEIECHNLLIVRSAVQE